MIKRLHCVSMQGCSTHCSYFQRGFIQGLDAWKSSGRACESTHLRQELEDQEEAEEHRAANQGEPHRVLRDHTSDCAQAGRGGTAWGSEQICSVRHCARGRQKFQCAIRWCGISTLRSGGLRGQCRCNAAYRKYQAASALPCWRLPAAACTVISPQKIDGLLPRARKAGKRRICHRAMHSNGHAQPRRQGQLAADPACIRP